MAIKIAGTEVINDNKELVLAKLTEINTSISVTAIDVFVYDTSKDSDGGAWRKRTQGTSWYNETLNTATRGSRREFPAVAVIVAEATKVTIYDGDDPSLPMWMEFNGGAGNMMAANSCSSVAMLNGRLTVGNFLYDVVSIDFAGDRAARAGVSTIFGPYLGNVLTRNSNSGWASNTASFFTNGPIVNRTVYDVAMTVLPNAPIDPATGLPVPTIAVATEGGVSVIRDDGNVWDITFSGGWGSAIGHVEIANGNLYFQQSIYYWLKIPLSAVTQDYVISGYGFSATAPFVQMQPNGNSFSSAAGVAANDAPFELVYPFGPSAGNGVLLVGNDASMRVKTTSTYNTGWMNGDIKGAFLSDTDDTDLVGSGELVTNGTFDTDVSGWTDNSIGGSSISWNASGYINLNVSAASENALADQSIVTVVGQTYVISVAAINSVNSTAIFVGTSLGSNNLVSQSVATSGSYSFTFTATTTTTHIRLFSNNGGGGAATASLDNVSVKLADADRSVNNNGLIVNGTVTRTFVDEV